MAPNLATPVLVVDTDLIHKVDTRNVENLMSMWTVFSKCSGSVEQGRRLENLSWRLWNRETFCCESETSNSSTSTTTTSSALDIPVTNNVSNNLTINSDVPDLSGSVDSVADNDYVTDSDSDSHAETPLEMTRPTILRQDSGASSRSRGCERHINPNDLEKMISNIKHTSPATIKLQPPLTIPSNLSSPTLEADEERVGKEQHDVQRVSSSTDMEASVFDQLPRSDRPVHHTPPSEHCSPTQCTSISTISKHTPPPTTLKLVSSFELATSLKSIKSSTSVVRGFSPAQPSNSYRSVPITSIPAVSLSHRVSTKTGNSKAVFALGGSSQSDASYGGSSTEGHMHNIPVIKKKPVFALGASSGSGDDDGSLPSIMNDSAHRSSLSSGRRPVGQAKKQTSFMEQVEERRIGDDNVFEDTEDEDDIDESAIDDDDDEDDDDWEDDSIDDTSGKSSVDQKTFFQRVDSRPNLTSRRSMLTTLLHQGDRAAALGNIASKSSPSMYRSRTSSPAGPSLAASPDSDVDNAPLMMRKKNPRLMNGPSAPPPPNQATQPMLVATNPIPMAASTHQLALSPKTTRRNMLASELTASLRRNLLWERQQKNQTATAVLKRRHTAQTDLKDLKEFPKEALMKKDIKETTANWNQYFGQGLGEYHSKGW